MILMAGEILAWARQISDIRTHFEEVVKMKYITRVAGEPVLYKYRKNSSRHKYITEKLQKYRGEPVRTYLRPSPLTKLAESYYLSEAESKSLYEKARKTAADNWYFSRRAEVKVLAEKKGVEDLDGLGRFLYLPSVAYSNSCKEMAIKKPRKMRFELMELKTDGSHYEFLIRETIINRIVEWKNLPDVDTVWEYLGTHMFPKDKCYSEEDFLAEVENRRGYIHLVVEKRETAEFVCDLCYELILDSNLKNEFF